MLAGKVAVNSVNVSPGDGGISLYVCQGGHFVCVDMDSQTGGRIQDDRSDETILGDDRFNRYGCVNVEGIGAGPLRVT